MATNHALNKLTPAEMDRFAQCDKKRLELESSRVAPCIAARMTAPMHSVANMLREWEELVNAMGHDWETVDYLIDDYVYALNVRAALGEALNHLQSNPPKPLIEALSTLDRRFLDQTIQENPRGAGAIEPYLMPMADRAPNWLWNRRPRVSFW